MFRMIPLALAAALGFSLGVTYDRGQMRAECANGAGDWTGTICVGSDLLQ